MYIWRICSKLFTSCFSRSVSIGFVNIISTLLVNLLIRKKTGNIDCYFFPDLKKSEGQLFASIKSYLGNPVSCWRGERERASRFKLVIILLLVAGCWPQKNSTEREEDNDSNCFGLNRFAHLSHLSFLFFRATREGKRREKECEREWDREKEWERKKRYKDRKKKL